MSNLRVTAAALAFLFLCEPLSGDIRYRVYYIPEGPCEECSTWPEPADINNNWLVSGNNLDRYRQGFQAELWDPANPTTVRDLGGLGLCGDSGARVLGMNDLGRVVGWDGAPDRCSWVQACLWSVESGWIILDRLPDWRGSQAFAVNNLDQTVGVQGLTTAEPRSVACLWDPENGPMSLGRGPLEFVESSAYDINDSTWVVGRGNGPGGFGAFLWKPDEGMSIIPATVWQNRVAINDLGQVTSSEWRSSDSREAFVWDEDDGVQFLGWLPDDPYHSTEARDINNQGVVIGLSRIAGWVPNMELTSFVWSPRRGMLDLNRRRDPCNPVRELRDVLYAVAINDAGVIITVPESEFVKAALLIPYIPGDLDEDGVCDLADLAQLLSNFGRTAVGYAEGDLDCQGDVDLQDLATLLINFGDSLP